MKREDNFKTGNWNKSIDILDFIKLNYEEYQGDSSFLEKKLIVHLN